MQTLPIERSEIEARTVAFAKDVLAGGASLLETASKRKVKVDRISVASLSITEGVARQYRIQHETREIVLPEFYVREVTDRLAEERWWKEYLAFTKTVNPRAWDHALSVLTNAILLAENDQALSKVVSEFVEELSDTPRIITQSAFMACIQVAKESVCIKTSFFEVTFKTIEEADFQRWASTSFRGLPNPIYAGAVAEMQVSTKTYEQIDLHWHSLQVALSLQQPALPTLEYWLTDSRRYIFPSGAGMSGIRPEGLEVRGVHLSRNKAGRVESFLEAVWPFVSQANLIYPGPDPTGLQLAYGRYIDAIREPVIWERQIAFAVVALEGLWLGDSQDGQISLRLRLAKILGLVGEKPGQVSADVGHAYKIRNLFFHGRILTQSEREQRKCGYGSHLDFRNRIFDLVRWSILLQAFSSVQKQQLISMIDESLIDSSQDALVSTAISAAFVILQFAR